MNAVKHLVSKNKRRYRDDGFDLDLSYVMDNIIAMGYPSESMESMFRNSLDDVKRFLEERHEDHYKVYNLCSERSYDIQKFHGRVAIYPFDDHSPPEFSQILPFCRDMWQWLGEHQDNVAVVHCKAGKGRTGLMICAYLLFANVFKNAPEVLEYYGSKRTFDSNGVTIPSQRRYVDYFSTKISQELQYNPVKLMLTSIILEPPPHVGFVHHQAHIQFQIFQHFLAPFQSDVYTINWDDSKVVLNLPSPISLSGDVKISFTQKLNLNVLHLRNKPKFISTVPHSKLFHFWVNTFFIDREVSSELTHDINDVSISSNHRVRNLRVQSDRPIRRNVTYSKNLSPFPLRNRFAPLSLPDLKADFIDEADSSHDDIIDRSSKAPEVNGFRPVSASGLNVRLSKQQIDKASKDHTERFPENFTVTLVVSRMEMERREACAGTNGRGRM